MSDADRSSLDLAVAVIGMAVRVPGADHVEQLWRNLCGGVESMIRFGAEELARAGTPAEVLERPGFVPVNAPMPFADCFDAAFFAMSPREAELTDPQHRVFLESAWQALEDAGLDPSRLRAPVGVYAGCSFSQYLLKNLVPNPSVVSSVGLGDVIGRNVPDALASLVSYKLDLRGPSIAVQTACSTSLTAVHLAVQGLLAGDCDVALAGGVALTLPQTSGYLAIEGSVLSPDGHCRPFDRRAAGTVAGSGAAVVVLKRAPEALADGDPIRALIIGSAVNNDGAAKLGYSAPSIGAQAEVVSQALECAQVAPETIGYVEAHGTGTPLGDPVEVAALTRAYGGRARPGSCALGSIKSNIGHLDAAAGAAGLIKAALAVERGLIPPTLHVEEPNPRLHLEEGPFAIADRLQPWPAGGGPRRAGVSSLGLGGTNVHVVLEEPPPRPLRAPSDREELVVISGRTRAALDRNADNLRAHLAAHPELALSDVALTSREGRKAFPHRLALAARDLAELLVQLEPRAREERRARADGPAPVVFVFPGFAAGSLALGRGFRDLLAAGGVFRDELDRCLADLARRDGLDLAQWLRPDVDPAALAELERDQARAAPLMFAIQHALARQWIAWGVEPAAVVGHSAGEYAAAAVAGALAPGDACALLARRGRALQDTAPGAMIAIELPAAVVEELLPDGWDLAVENGPALCVASGPAGEAAALEEALHARGASHRRLPIDVAAHSRLVDPSLADFEAAVRACELRAPTVPFVSTLIGTWAGDELATPRYWSRQLRERVRFAAAAAELLSDPRRVFVEIGLGRGMTRLLLQQGQGAPVRALPSFDEDRASGRPASLLDAAGRLWAMGGLADLGRIAGPGSGRKVPLPTYAFERSRFWVEPPARRAVELQAPPAAPTYSSDDDAEVAEPLTGPLEAEIAQVWSEVLGTARIGAGDNFFLLGGSSMMLAVVAARLSERLGANVPLRSLLEAPTPRALAAALERTGAARRPAAAIPRRSDDEPVPLTWAQEHVWTFLAAGADRGAQNYTWAIELEGPLELDVLASSLAALAERQDVLRAVIVPLGSHVGQAVRPGAGVDFRVTRLDAADRASQLADVRRLASADRRRPFDPFAGPLAMARVIQLGPERHVLVCTASLLVLDGWSSAIFTEEWSELYRAALSGRPADLRPLPVRYRDLAHWQRLGEGVAPIERLVADFKRRFGDPPRVPRLPPGRARPARRSFRGAQVCSSIPADLVERAQRLGRSLGEPFGAVARAAFAVLLSRWTGAERFLLNTGNSNRTDPAFAGLIGFVANGMAFRVELSGSPSFEEVIRRGRAATLESLELQDCPLGRLYREWPSEGRLENPLFCATFIVLTPQSGAPIAFGEARGELLAVRSSDAEEYALPSREDLWVTLDEEPDGSFAATLQHDLDVIDPGTAAWLAEAYVAMLAAAVEAPGAPIAALPLSPAPPGPAPSAGRGPVTAGADGAPRPRAP